MIQKVLPAIRAKWPRDMEDIIFIQQDNVRPHIDPNDTEFLEDASSDGFNIHLSSQPPNSPNMNVLDLGFFRAIQSLQQQEELSIVNDLEKAFNELPPQSLNCVFLRLRQCMIEVIKDFRGNNYKLPHMGKEKLEKQGPLPLQLECGPDIIERAFLYLQQIVVIHLLQSLFVLFCFFVFVFVLFCFVFLFFVLFFCFFCFFWREWHVRPH